MVAMGVSDSSENFVIISSKNFRSSLAVAAASAIFCVNRLIRIALMSSAVGKNRYRIEVGWNDGVKVGNIVGAIANEGEIGGEYIGPIKIHDSYATVDLPEGMPLEIYNTLQRTRVAGKPMEITLANDDMGVSTDSASPSRPRHTSKFRGKSPKHSKGPGRGKSFHPAAKRKKFKGKTASQDHA